VDAWDAWLQECIHESRQALQDSWLGTYLTGPVWRFAFASGVCSGGAYAGILVPSVDRVGRYFPLTVVTQLAPDDCPLAIACTSTEWFESAETLVLDAIQAEALDFDTFDERVALLRDRLDMESAGEASRLAQVLRDSDFPGREKRWQISLGTVGSLQSAVSAFAYREMSRALDPLAIWWTQGSGALEPSWLSTRGLPDARAFVAMLTGDWSAADWATVPAGGASPLAPSAAVLMRTSSDGSPSGGRS
jgi:type VI secretion system protein ImpM